MKCGKCNSDKIIKYGKRPVRKVGAAKKTEQMYMCKKCCHQGTNKHGKI